MKQKLLFLLTTLLLLSTGNAWGDEVSTFNFKGKTDKSTPTLSGANHHKAANAQQVQVAVDEVFGGKFAFQNVGDGNGFYYTTTQLVQFKGDRYFSILELSAGDKIEFTFSTADSGSSTDKHFTVENSGTSSTTNLSLTKGGDAIAANTDLVSGTAYYVLADGYVDFKTRKNVYFDKVVITKSNSSLPKLNRVWGQNFKSLGKEFQTEITTDGGTCSYGVAVAGDANFFYLSADGENAFTNRNVGFYVAYSGNGNHRRWKLYNGTDGLKNVTNASNTIHIYNLTKGQVVKVSGSALPTCGGVLSSLNEYDGTNTRYYQATATGTGNLTIEKQKYIYSIEVFNLDAEVIGLLDCSTGFNTVFSGPISIAQGSTMRLRFTNHGKGEAVYHGYCLMLSEGSTEFTALTCDWRNTYDVGTWPTRYQVSNDGGLTYNWIDWGSTTMASDLKDAVGEILISNNSGTITVNSTLTKGSNIYASGWTISGKTGNITAKLSVDCAWIEILSIEQTAGNVTLKVNNGKLGTFIAPFDVELPAGVKAYSATSDAEKVILTKEYEGGQTLPAGTPVIVYGDGVTVNETFNGTFVVNENRTVGALTGMLVDKTVPANAYVLQTQGGNQAFYQLETSAIASFNRCYVTANSVGAGARLAIVFEDDDPTAIKAIEAAEAEAEGGLKDGKYIIDGKIVIVKNGVMYSTNGQKLN